MVLTPGETLLGVFDVVCPCIEGTFLAAPGLCLSHLSLCFSFGSWVL